MHLFVRMVTLTLRGDHVGVGILQNNFWPKYNAIITNLRSLFFLACVKYKSAALESRKSSQYEFCTQILIVPLPAADREWIHGAPVCTVQSAARWLRSYSYTACVDACIGMLGLFTWLRFFLQARASANLKVDAHCALSKVHLIPNSMHSIRMTCY